MATCRRCQLAYDGLPYAPCPRCGTPSEAAVVPTKSPRAATTERPASDLARPPASSFSAPISDPVAPTPPTIPLDRYPSPQLAAPPPNAYPDYATAATYVPGQHGALAVPQSPMPYPASPQSMQGPPQPVPYPTAQPQQQLYPYPGHIQVIVQNQVNPPYPQAYPQAYPMTYAPAAHYPIAPYVRRKDPGVATLLSFFIPGAGQLYNGQVGKGCAFLAVSLVNFLLMFIGIGFFTGLVTWIWGMVDAHGSAEKINRGQIVV
jgi:TM2 domain-containing membrane protein YozV